MDCTENGKVALAYSDWEIPVFPIHSLDSTGVCTCGGSEVNPRCKPGKHPRVPKGHQDATTNPDRITAWWKRWPEANIGVPTGKRSGWLVLDVDPDKGGLTSLGALEQKHGKLPQTKMTRTGGGGNHYLYRYPDETEIRNSAGKLGPGLDIRGEGGYILAPGSVTDGPYEWLDDRSPLAEPPEWLLEGLRSDSRGPSGPGPLRSSTPIMAAGEKIPEGTRNDNLTREAGRLHNGTRDLDALAADLLEVNATRCVPPLPEREVRGIASSIFKLPPCKPGGPNPGAEILEAIKRLEAAQCTERIGMGAFSRWAIYRALLNYAKRYGCEHPKGVLVSVDMRTLAQDAGMGLATAKRAVDGLKDKGLILRYKRSGKGRSGAFVLVCEPCSKTNDGPTATASPTPPATVPPYPPIGVQVEHSNHIDGSAEEFCSTYDSFAENTFYRLRWGAGRINKIGGAILEAMYAASVSEVAANRGQECSNVTISRVELARRLNRKPESLKKTLTKLVNYGLIDRTSWGIYRLADNFAQVLAEAREIGGEPDAERRDMYEYARQREAYRRRLENRSHRIPVVQTLQGQSGVQNLQPEVPDGFVEELQHVEGLIPEPAKPKHWPEPPLEPAPTD